MGGVTGDKRDEVIRGSSSVGRARAFQARCRGFEPRLPLYRSRFARVAQSVEHSLGKGEVIGSIPIASSVKWDGGRRMAEGSATALLMHSTSAVLKLKIEMTNADRTVNWPYPLSAIRHLPSELEHAAR